MCKLDTGERNSIAPQNNDAADLLAVQKTLQGSSGAFTEIVERYTPIFYSLACRVLGDLDEAEDAVQDIFFQAFRSLRSFKIHNRFYTWIYTVGLNLLRSRLHWLDWRLYRSLTQRILRPQIPYRLLSHRPQLILHSLPSRQILLW